MAVCTKTKNIFYVSNGNITRFDAKLELKMRDNRERVGHKTVFSGVGKVNKIVLDSWKRYPVFSVVQIRITLHNSIIKSLK